MSAFSYACSLPVTWQRWRSHHSIRHSGKPHAAWKLHSSMLYRTGVIANRSFTLREYKFSTFWLLWSDDLYIWTWLVKSVEIYRMCKYELPTSTLSKVIVWQTDRQTHRQDRNYIPRRFEGGPWNDNVTCQLMRCSDNIDLALNFMDSMTRYNELCDEIIHVQQQNIEN